MADQWGLIPLPIGQAFDPEAAEQPEQPADIFGGLIAGWTAGGLPAITGTLAATESGQDSASSTARVRVAGTLSASESGVDGLAAQGKVRVSGALAVAEPGTPDSLAASARLTVRGLLASVEAGQDTTSVLSRVRVAGALSASEQPDTASASASLRVSGTASLTETGGDVLDGSGPGAVSWGAATGVLAALEAADAFAAAAAARIEAQMAALESGADRFAAGTPRVLAPPGDGFARKPEAEQRLDVELEPWRSTQDEPVRPEAAQEARGAIFSGSRDAHTSAQRASPVGGFRPSAGQESRG